MPIGEVLLGVTTGSICAGLVVYLRPRGRDRWAERVAAVETFREPRLAAVMVLFALAAVGLDSFA